MSFGFSAGDFVAAAELIFEIGEALSDAKGASRDYRELLQELNPMSLTVTWVDRMESISPTIRAIISNNKDNAKDGVNKIHEFLKQNDDYNKSLGEGGGSKSVLKD